MAVPLHIPVRFEDVFPHGACWEVAAANDFDKVKANAPDVQTRDKDNRRAGLVGAGPAFSALFQSRQVRNRLPRPAVPDPPNLPTRHFFSLLVSCALKRVVFAMSRINGDRGIPRVSSRPDKFRVPLWLLLVAVAGKGLVLAVRWCWRHRVAASVAVGLLLTRRFGALSLALIIQLDWA